MRSELDQQLRMFVQLDGRSLNALAKQSGIDRSYLHRFMRERQSLGLRSVDRLCQTLGVQLRLERAATSVGSAEDMGHVDRRTGEITAL